jgi:hypothetical protein
LLGEIKLFKMGDVFLSVAEGWASDAGLQELAYSLNPGWVLSARSENFCHQIQKHYENYPSQFRNGDGSQGPYKK